MTDEFTSANRTGRYPLPAAMTAATLVLVLAVALWAAHGARTARERTDSLQQTLDVRLAELTARIAARSGQDSQVAAAIGTLTDVQAALESRLEHLDGARRSGLLGAEAEHMVRLAAQRLALLQDPAGALALLAAADAAIRDIRGADTHAARAAIASDSAALRAADRLDVEALYLRLAALPEQAERLAARARADAVPAVPSPAAPAAVPSDTTTWWSRAVTALSSLVTVRRVDEHLDPMITDGERTLAAQNFRLLVEHAQAALLQRRSGIYAGSLAKADAWLTRISGGDPALRSALRRELSALRAMNVAQPLPELSASLAATRALVVRLAPEAGDMP